jgi:hypothetical protein
LKGVAEGIHAHVSPDGSTLLAQVYLRSGARFRAIPDRKTGTLTLEYRGGLPEPAAPAHALYLPPAKDLDEAYLQLDELRVENLPASIVLTADGKVAVQVAATSSRSRAAALERQVLGYQKPGITAVQIVPQPLANRVRLGM